MRAAVHAVLHHQDARHGTGPGDRAIRHQRSPWQDLCGEPAGEGRDVPDRAAGRASELIRYSAPMGKNLRVAIVALWLPGLPAFGQWVNVPALKAPRTKSGEIDLQAPTPRLPDGKPDLSGSWSPD